MKVLLQFMSGVEKVEDWDPNTELSKHFTLRELANNMGDPKLPQYIYNRNVDLFNAMHEEFRVWFNRPYTPNCGYRQPDYNKSVGGIGGSMHTKALAVDIPFPDMTDTQWRHISDKWKDICEHREVVGECGRYKWGFHLGAFITYSDLFYSFDKR